MVNGRERNGHTGGGTNDALKKATTDGLITKEQLVGPHGNPRLARWATVNFVAETAGEDEGAVEPDFDYPAAGHGGAATDFEEWGRVE
jgi:hypothetical protein